VSLRIVPVGPDTVGLWRDIHNAIIPAHQLTGDDAHERLSRNSLTLAYVGEDLVGNATIRPPRPDSMTATVIVRILPGYRREGVEAIRPRDRAPTGTDDSRHRQSVRRGR
jgi:hypothetical protein